MRRFYHKQSMLTLFLICLSACVPITTTERGAVVIFNDLSNTLQYRLLLSQHWTKVANIEKDEFDYVLEYDDPRNENQFPRELSQLEFTFGNCVVNLSKNELTNAFVRDPGGRNTWDIHVTREMLTGYECEKL
jgi:hypothetical protein